MEPASLPPEAGANVLVGVSVMMILGAMAAGWLLRALLLRLLEKRDPGEFARLGSPSSRQLASLLPRHREMQILFWKYLWEGRIFRTKDAQLFALGAAALAADVVLVAGLALLAWVAWS